MARPDRDVVVPYAPLFAEHGASAHRRDLGSLDRGAGRVGRFRNRDDHARP